MKFLRAVLIASVALPQSAYAATAVPPSNNGYPFFVVTACGAADFSDAVGNYRPGTMDTSGKQCSSAVGGGGGSAADQTGTNSTDGQATTSANQHALAFEYIYNGPTWDRARGLNGTRYVAIPDIRGLGTLDATSTTSKIDIPLNGTSSVGLRLSGFAGNSNVAFYISNDGGTTYTQKNPVNCGNPSAATTNIYSTEGGQPRIDVAGDTNLRVIVNSPGTGTINYAYNLSSAPLACPNIQAVQAPDGTALAKAGIAYPLLTTVTTNTSGAAIPVAGNYYFNLSGTFGGGTVTLTSTLNGLTTTVGTYTAAASVPLSIFAGTTLTATLTGATSPSITATLNGGPPPVSGTIFNTTTSGDIQPARAPSGKITKNSTTLVANTSTVIAPSNANRIGLVIQCAAGGVQIDETGGTLTSATSGGTLTITTAQANNPYIPPVPTLTAVTAYGAAQQCIATEYNR